MSAHTVATLQAASKAAAYEYTMLRAGTRLLTTPDVRQALGDRVVLDTVGSLYLPSGIRMRHAVKNSLIEAFAIHARCLIEFLFYRPNDTYVRACDFFGDVTTWEAIRPAKTDSLLDAEEKANALAAHVSVRRVELIEMGRRAWHFERIYEDLDVVWLLFVGHELKERLHPDLGTLA